jgi:phosphoesterase RecJ-like protein
MAALLYAGLVFDTGGFRHSNTKPSTLRRAATLLEHDIDHPSINVKILAERTQAGLSLMGRVIGSTQFLAEGRVATAVIPLSLMYELGAVGADKEGIVDALLYTAGVEVACLITEANAGTVKLSLRSRKIVDVAALAQAMTPHGGGHARAAGARISKPLAEALPLIMDHLTAAAEGC